MTLFRQQSKYKGTPNLDIRVFFHEFCFKRYYAKCYQFKAFDARMDMIV